MALGRARAHRTRATGRRIGSGGGDHGAGARTDLRRHRRHDADAGWRVHHRALGRPAPGTACSGPVATATSTSSSTAARPAGAPTNNWSPGCASAAPTLGPLAAIDWSKFDPTRASQAEVDAMEAPIAGFFVHTRQARIPRRRAPARDARLPGVHGRRHRRRSATAGARLLAGRACGRWAHAPPLRRVLPPRRRASRSRRCAGGSARLVDGR